MNLTNQITIGELKRKLEKLPSEYLIGIYVQGEQEGQLEVLEKNSIVQDDANQMVYLNFKEADDIFFP